MNKWYGVALALCLMWQPAGAQQVLRAGVANDTSEPLRQAGGDGALQAYRAALALIARQSGIRFQLDYYPTQRLEQLFQIGRLDVEVGVNPAWRTLSPVAGFYTQPIGEVEFQLCLPPGKKRQPVTLAEMKGWTVGTLAGMHYPLLEPAFQSQRIKRDVSTSEDELLDKLRLGQVQAVALERGRAWYWNHRIEGSRCQLSESAGRLPVMLRLHPQYRDLLPRLNQAIQTLNSQGKLKPLFALHSAAGAH
ncbi:substrate-binding periplasmic protein [Chromobacterium paludis]|uniref:ABC transporter substrate-binding protein n=1 Tax=Chromobacterium paludis TaxID=2605945 RepID=A0A5C1DLX8_9NEIS|nr:ABC transporter substrate-binding protein [Chromobacterium paludis]QEL57664.1 ABC transporter substrate-binding protein [Chromobacterium paludis]